MSASEYLNWLNDQSDSELICHARHKDRSHEMDSSRHYAVALALARRLEDANRLIKSDEDHFFCQRPLDGLAAVNVTHADTWHAPYHTARRPMPLTMGGEGTQVP